MTRWTAQWKELYQEAQARGLENLALVAMAHAGRRRRHPPWDSDVIVDTPV